MTAVSLVASDPMPRRRVDVFIADFDTQLVVLVPEGRMVHHLNEGLSLVLDACDGERLVGDVVAEMAEATDSTDDQVLEWLADAIATLDELGMLERTPDAASGRD